MIRTANTRFLRKNFWQLAIFVAVAVCLLFLFEQAQPVDPKEHNSLIGDLREFQRLDTKLGETVLQHYYQLYHNYDNAVTIMKRMQFLAAGLAHRQQKKGLLPDSPLIMRELSELHQRVEQKAAMLEEFKSHNAVIKNSFLYLPRQVNLVLETLPESQHDPFELLIRDLLLITLHKNEYARTLLKLHIEEVERNIPNLPEHTRPLAISVTLHAKSIMVNEIEITESLAQLSSVEVNALGANLENNYLRHYSALQKSASFYRLLLLLAAMALFGYAVHVYIKMRGREQQLRIAAAAFETQEGILITDLDHRIIQVNQAFTKLTGYQPDEALGQTPDLLKSGRHDEEFYPRMWATIGREKYWQGEVWSRRKNGEIYPVWLTTTAVTDAEKNITHYVSVFADISLRKDAEEQIHQLAFYDPLTNLPNRRLLVDRLSHTMVSGKRSEDHGAVLFIDLDNFKTLNDTKGHDVGDLLLVETAKRLQFCVRGGDTVARLGGDEFVIMLEGLGEGPEHAAAQAKSVGEKIRETLSQTYHLRDTEYHGSCSIGISLFHGNSISVEDLLKRADTAMYEAKSSGRNTLRFFDPSMQSALELRAKLEVDLRNAITLRQFVLHFQVQVNDNNRPVGAEVLLRWANSERGLVFPSEFIATAENTGLILPIGQWVLDAACAQIKTWEANPEFCAFQLAVNVSARQFHQPNFVAQVKAAIDRSGAHPNRLKIELTESVVLDDVEDTAAKMRELKKMGILFSMDDFGTGYSSLAYLTRLPLNQLKIDQSFVHNISIKDSDAVIVQTIIGMANSLEMEVIAEGVETEAQHAFLKHAGCKLYQGYLFGRPMSLAEFESNVSKLFSAS